MTIPEKPQSSKQKYVKYMKQQEKILKYMEADKEYRLQDFRDWQE